MPLTIKKATRKAVKLKIGMFGASGSGKTFSALILAAGLGQALMKQQGKSGFGRTLVIDTENESASLYADHPGLPAGFDFDTISIQPPFLPKKLNEAIKLGVSEHYDFVIIDGLAPFWAGSGGLLSMKDGVDSSKQFTQSWSKISKYHAELVETLLQSPVHIIATCRMKQEYALEKNDEGKNVVKKLGLGVQFREGLDYELTTVFEIDNTNHTALVSKDRTGIWDTTYGKVTGAITAEYGKKLADWLASGKAVMDVKVVETKEEPQEEQQQEPASDSWDSDAKPVSHSPALADADGI